MLNEKSQTQKTTILYDPPSHNIIKAKVEGHTLDHKLSGTKSEGKGFSTKRHKGMFGVDGNNLQSMVFV